MSLNVCAVSRDHGWPETDPDGVPCCMGSAMHGPGACTCWEPVYDLAQAEPRPGPLEIRPTPCADCAFRPDSPERTGTGGVQDQDELDGIVARAERFWCHDGIRRPLVHTHPSGATVPGDPFNYCPPIQDAIPYRADGRPALLCAGWSARVHPRGARPGLEPYDPSRDPRTDWKRSLCGRPHCRSHALWVLVDVVGHRRNLCGEHARRAR